MIFKTICSNLIKWWYVIYTPIARKIWPSKKDKELYQAEHPEEFKEEASDESSADPDVDSIHSDMFSNDSVETCTEPDAVPDASLLHNKNYNVTTHAMSGEYGKGPLDEEAKAKLDAILQNNYNASQVVSAINTYAVIDDTETANKDMDDPEMNDESAYDEETYDAAEDNMDSPLSEDAAAPDESEDAMEQIRQAEEIYERLRREAAEDEARKQAEIEAAKNAAEIG